MAEPAPSPLRDALGGMLGMAAAMGIGRFVYTPILPGMMEALGQTAAQAGLIASANYLGYLLGALAAAGGWARGRERALMSAALVANAALLLAMAGTGELGLFVAIRFLAGLASAFMFVFGASIVLTRIAAAGRPELQALFFGGVGIGIALSSLATGAAEAAGFGWRTEWIAAGLLGMLAAAAVPWLIGPGPAQAGPATPSEPRLPRDPALSRIILAYGLFGIGYVVTATFLVAIVRAGAAGHGLETLVWLVTGLSAAAGLIAWAPLSRRFGAVAAMAAACLVEAGGVLASVALPGPAGPLLGALLLGATFIPITAFGLQAARAMAPRSPRRVLALMTAAFGTGQIVGPIVAGWAADLTGSFTAPSIGAAAVLVACAVIAWPARRGGMAD